MIPSINALRLMMIARFDEVNLKLGHNLAHLEEMEVRSSEWLKKIEGNNTSILNRLDALEEAVTKIIAARDTTQSLEDLHLRHEDLST